MTHQARYSSMLGPGRGLNRSPERGIDRHANLLTRFFARHCGKSLSVHFVMLRCDAPDFGAMHVTRSVEISVDLGENRHAQKIAGQNRRASIFTKRELYTGLYAGQRSRSVHGAKLSRPITSVGLRHARQKRQNA
jgi:hypothetical protein